MSSNVIDQTRDENGQHFWALLNVGHNGSRLFNPPDFVKKASSTDICGRAETPVNVFCDPASRQFPCHTRPATWVSAVFFHMQKDEMPKEAAIAIEKRLERAAEVHGILGEIQSIKQAVLKAKMEPELPDEDFALVFTNDLGHKEKHYRLHNANDIKAACSYLEKYDPEFPFEERRIFADKVLRKAAALGVDLGVTEEWLEKKAGWGSCSSDMVIHLLKSRADALVNAGRGTNLIETLAKTAAACKNDPNRFKDPETLWKMASLIDKVDREYRLNKDELPSLDELFGVTIKKAEKIVSDHFVLCTGTIYEKSALAHLNMDDVRSVMGEPFAEAVSDGGGLFLNFDKLAKVASDMPLPDAQLFERMVRASDIRPVAREPMHEGVHLGAEGLSKLAEMHEPA
jgi:hypothetical protein